MNYWETYNLSDICRFVTSRTCNIENYISTENMLPNKGGITSPSNIPNGSAIAYQLGDVLISNIRPYFQKIWLANCNGACSADVLCIRANEKANSKYLYYLLSQQKFFDYVMSGAKGCKMPRGDKSQIMQWQIFLPPLAEQKRIADILSAIDDKIELNRRINANLEQQAQALYKSWFVDADSTGWETKRLADFFNVITGKKDANYSTKDGVYPFFTCSQDILKAPNYSFEGAAILLAGNGDFNVKRYIGKFEAYQRTYVLIPFEKRYHSFLYLLIKYHLQEITGGSRGSVIKFITKGNIADFTFTMPPYSIDEKLSLFDSLFNEIDKNTIEINNLSTIRDTLLPKLMSGEIKA
ncbi:MAG: restriction endonuclease subunit S [Paludibacteraceae bacterium]|nr:restriction endonuclease subunit S [Paludibacteraceae bacterium]